MNRLLVVTNAAAGSTDDERVDAALAVLRAAADVRVDTCADPGDLDRLLDGLGDRTLVLAGGDGSVHTAVATLHRRGELSPDRPLALLPLGTGNDLARNLGIPLEPMRAARLLVDGRTHDLDLLVDDDGGVVLNAVHAGVGATAATYARRFKPYLKAAAFPLGAVIAGAHARGWRLRVEADGRLVTEDKLLMVALSNAPGIAGGTARLAPDAAPDDGRLRLVTCAATGPIARVRYALSLRDGAHRHRDDVLHVAATTVTVSGEAFLTNGDGEIAGPFTRRTWRLMPKAWRIKAPDAAA